MLLWQKINPNYIKCRRLYDNIFYFFKFGAGIAEVRFSYVADNGPENWGKLSPNFNTCSTGKHQSPVDIMQNKTAQRQELGPLSKEYYSVNATLMNSGYSIGVRA